MTAMAADLDNDGWTDLYVACDSTPSYLLRNQRNGTLKDELSIATPLSARTAWSKLAWVSRLPISI